MGPIMSNIVPLQPYPGHPLRALKKFAAKADGIVRHYDELDKPADDIRQKMEATTDREQIDRLFADANRAAVLDKHEQATLEWCVAAVPRFDPDENYEIDDDGQYYLKPNVVGARVAVLVGSFPSTPSVDPSVFLKALIESVCSFHVSLVAVDNAIWEAVGTLKFIPATSEFLPIVKRQQAKWSKRFEAITELAESSRCVVAELEELQDEAEKAAKTRAVEQAQRDLNYAHVRRDQAIVEARDAQTWAAIAAEEVASKLASVAQCEARVSVAEQALAEAVKAAS
jgi:hypothetical protein